MHRTGIYLVLQLKMRRVPLMIGERDGLELVTYPPNSIWIDVVSG